MHALHLMSEDDDNMCARDTRIVINAYVLRELDRAACTASIISSSAFTVLSVSDRYMDISVHQSVH